MEVQFLFCILLSMAAAAGTLQTTGEKYTSHTQMQNNFIVPKGEYLELRFDGRAQGDSELEIGQYEIEVELNLQSTYHRILGLRSINRMDIIKITKDEDLDCFKTAVAALYLNNTRQSCDFLTDPEVFQNRTYIHTEKWAPFMGADLMQAQHVFIVDNSYWPEALTDLDWKASDEEVKAKQGEGKAKHVATNEDVVFNAIVMTYAMVKDNYLQTMYICATVLGSALMGLLISVFIFCRKRKQLREAKEEINFQKKVKKRRKKAVFDQEKLEEEEEIRLRAGGGSFSILNDEPSLDDVQQELITDIN